MMAVAPLTVAVTAHRAAYDAFQIAPEGEDSVLADDAMFEALDGLVTAATAFPILTRPLPAGAGALLAHLRWWLSEEAEFAEDYQPAYGILQGRAADLGAVLDPPVVDDADPVVAAIVAADKASVAHTAALVHRDEDDDESEAVIDAAGHAVDEAFRAVQALMPTTLASLHALASFYARDAKIFCRWDTGGDYLEHIAAALALLLTNERQAPLILTEAPIRETKGIPGQAEVEAAWRSLPPRTRDRIGVIATDLVFQAFVHGDAFVATGAPKDRAVPGRSRAAQAIRDAAAEAETERLNELHQVVERNLPDLFGPDGGNPAWAVAMGARP
ncbi:hypothetical protein Q8W71_17535 [Methylobacterium sp. NEAU 140]|uniref:hypothetical protein n=1 Tax=Methylobacterium sp. NEAU 140 TaxID=3064945 RepID=UPI002736B8B1|nr:hypothetical protein [Methylobacterium sp. NEAU 140]MDP4024430.1 hypothetical protein [Methylobacterium sp. NEAU 140]